MGKEIKILFEVNDTDKIKLGKTLNRKHIDKRTGFDWSIESMLVAMEVADDNGIKFKRTNYDGYTYIEFYCKINGIIYYVIDDSRTDLKIKRINKKK